MKALIQLLISVSVLTSLGAACRLAYIEYGHNWKMFAVAALAVLGWASVAALVVANKNSD